MNPEELTLTPPEIKDLANSVVDKLLPTKSRPKYEKEYNRFTAWCAEKEATSINEKTLLAYFNNMSDKNKSSTMWSNYSMLRTCLSIYKGIDISKFLQLRAFLRRQSQNYEPKKSMILDFEQIEKFIADADDNTFLAMKVILIVGYSGACRRDELLNMAVKDIEFKSDSIVVSVPKTKNYISRLFLITDEGWINLLKKYSNMRPLHAAHDRFFITYRNGRCTVSPMGINTIGEVPKRIATFLHLPNPGRYTGHCFRRSSATHLASQGGDLLAIKKHGGWKSSAVAEGYVDDSLRTKLKVANMLSCRSAVVNPSPSTSSAFVQPLPESSAQDRPDITVTSNKNNVVVSEQSFPGITISASDNATVSINIYSHLAFCSGISRYLFCSNKIILCLYYLIK